MSGTEWKRLGDMVVRRRGELGMRTTKALAERAGLVPRTLGDVENGRRGNYADETKAAIEQALYWEYGSIDKVVAGGEPVPSVNPTTEYDRNIVAGRSFLESAAHASEIAMKAQDLRRDVQLLEPYLDSRASTAFEEVVLHLAELQYDAVTLTHEILSSAGLTRASRSLEPSESEPVTQRPPREGDPQIDIEPREGLPEREQPLTSDPE